MTITPENIEQSLQDGLKRHQAGDLAGAEGIYRAVLEAQPNNPRALHLLGLVAGHFGRNDAAVDLISRAVRSDPGMVEARANLGVALARVGKSREAIEAFQKAITLRPDYSHAYNGLGNAFKDAGELDKAIVAYSRAITLQPDFVAVYNNLANVLREKREFGQAIATLNRAIQIEPNYAEAFNSRGVVLAEIGRLDQAIDDYRRAAKLDPKYPEPLNNLGNAMRELDRMEEAVSVFSRALQIKHDYAEAHANLAIVQRETGRVDDSIASSRKAIEFSSNLAEAHWNLAQCLLLKGDFNRGWMEYEWRWKVRSFGPPREFSQPRWYGKELQGQPILLHAEQGLGDIIQFARYAKDVADHGGQVILETPPSLAKLMRSAPGVSQIATIGEPLPEFAWQCSILSLPLVFNTDLESIPAPQSYLSADEAMVESWKTKLGSADGKKRVGLVWSGEPANVYGRSRSLELSQLAPLAAVNGAEFHGLQLGEAAKQKAPEGMNVRDWSAEIHDFSDTAALIANLDLIITIDTSVAHLAGALGKETWVMLRFAPDWRWLLDRSESLWYPSLRLFRPKTRGDWAGVIQNVADQLQSRLANPS